MSTNQPFYPHYGAGQQVVPGAASARIEIGAGDTQVEFINWGTVHCWIRFGDSSVVATIDDYFLPAGSESPNNPRKYLISKDKVDTHMAYLTAAAPTTTLNIMPGEGF